MIERVRVDRLTDGTSHDPHSMITALIYLLIAALVLWIVYFLVGKFIQGTPLQIVGIILGLILLLYALNLFGVLLPANGPPPFPHR